MSLINLKLIKDNDQKYNQYYFNDIIEKENLIILLGAPGSGKTTMLETYQKANPSICEIKKIIDMLNSNFELLPNTKILLLDGLDEYRCVESHKTFVLVKLANVINNLTNIKTIVISCREMDWYGESDANALKYKINQNPSIFYIQPLDYNQKTDFAKHLQIASPKTFVDKYTEYGFLETPHLFIMCAQIHKFFPDLKSKKELFDKFIENSLYEINPEHRNNTTSELINSVFFKQLGYLAFYYIFCNVDEFDEMLLNKICDEKKYSKKNLEATLKTKLFKQKTFVHRTIAEYVLAKFIFDELYKDNKNRIKELFLTKDMIPTEKRGAFAWLCSLTADDELLKIDPYYQLIHGDNSLFDTELKRKIILEVKNYSFKNLAFFNFNQISGLYNFYNKELDHFLIQEFNDNLNLNSYYIYFIIYIFNTANNLSSNVYKFLQNQLLDKNIDTNIKFHILKGFKSEDKFEFLNFILEKIKSNEISDSSDNLKEFILNTLYLNRIDSTEIVDYLFLYNEKVIGHCFYLFNTPYSDKQNQITLIYKKSFKEDESINDCLPVNAKSYIEDYFLETILKYEESFSAIQIYEILIHFKQYYKVYEEIHIGTYRYEITNKLKESEQKIAKLSKELFCLFLDDLIKNNNLVDLHFFKYLFNLRLPNNISTLILEKIDSTISRENNIELFHRAFAYSATGNNQDYLELAKTKAKEFDLNDELFKRLNPPKNKWDEEIEKNKKAREEEIKKNIKKNEKYFSSKSKEEIQNNFSDLFFIAELNFFEQKESVLTTKTFKRLSKVLANAIYHKPLNSKLQSIKSLANDAPEGRRNIDTLYYTSCALNKSNVNFNKLDKNLLSYFYINSLLHSRIHGIIKSNFHLQVEVNELHHANKVLIEYLILLLKKYLPELVAIFKPYIIAQNDIEDFKLIIHINKHEGFEFSDSLLFNLLNTINFKIKLKDLKIILKKKICLRNKNIVEALTTFANQKRAAFTELMAVSIYSIFQYKPEVFNKLDIEIKIRLIDYMIKNFSKSEDLYFTDGIQSAKDECITFLKHKGLDFELKDLIKLQEMHKVESEDIWSLLISQKINELSQREVDTFSQTYDIDKIKNFILLGRVTSYKDFYIYIISALESLKLSIQDESDNDKNAFYSGIKPKNENDCRDIIVQRLKGKYEYDLIINREQAEGINKADICFMWRTNHKFIVQVECKLDNHPKLYENICDQLIKKYLNENVLYGIYLVFYFGRNRSSPETLINSLSAKIPNSKRDFIKIIIIDLRPKNKTSNNILKNKPLKKKHPKSTIKIKRQKRI